MAVGESRTELLLWLNSTLDLDYVKVEQCGTGAAYCQLMDSIYGNVPMVKVKFGHTLSDYDARNNMKILQAAFNKHKISKLIEVERLIKCRLQDNLELLQWFKRHWMENKDVNVDYDASSRRKSGANSAGNSAVLSRRATINGSNPASLTLTQSPKLASTTPSSRRVSSGNGYTAPISVQKRRVVSSGSATLTSALKMAPSNNKVAELTQELEQARDQLAEAKISVDSLETERNFYFNKLREIEIVTQNIQGEFDKPDSEIGQLLVLEVVNQVQEILYQTQKGFEVQDAMDTELF